MTSIVGWGDSNMANSDQFSYHERAYAKRFPYMRLCSAGQSLGSYATPHVQQLMRGYTIADIAMGTNNLGSDAATNLALLQAAVATFRAMGVPKVIVCTLPPSTSSTDGWTTVAGQTPQAEPNLSDLNAAIRNGDTGADVVFDAFSYVAVTAGNLFTNSVPGRWAVRSSPNNPTSAEYGNNVHYYERGHDAASVGFRVALDRVIGGETDFIQVNPDLGT